METALDKKIDQIIDENATDELCSKIRESVYVLNDHLGEQIITEAPDELLALLSAVVLCVNAPPQEVIISALMDSLTQGTLKTIHSLLVKENKGTTIQ